MHRRGYIAGLIFAVAVGAMGIPGVQRGAVANPPLPNMECLQGTACVILQEGDCTDSTTDCGEHTCTYSCSAKSFLMCKPKLNGPGCEELAENGCDPYVNVPKCKSQSGGIGPCWCDAQEPAGQASCPTKRKCQR